MKILILSNVFPPGFIGGYELGALDVAKGLQRKGHDVQVLTSNYFLDDQNELLSLKVSRSLICGMISHERTPTDHFQAAYYNFHNLRTLGSAVRQFLPDVVLTFNLNGLGGLSIIQYLQALKMPVILYLMDNIFWALNSGSPLHMKYEKLFGKLKLMKSTRIIAMSRNIAQEISKTLNLNLGEVTYIPGWVNIGKGPLEIELGRGGKTRFVFCSRVAPHKGIDIVVDVAEKLVQQGHINFTVDVYGAGLVPSFLQRVKSKNLEKFVRYNGLVSKSDILEILSGYDALLFPTWEREAFGFVVSEAAVAGCFPIMTAGIGASEWFLDGADCIKISRDSSSLRSAMMQVILWSDEEKVKNRIAAQITGRKHFSFDRWLNVINSICTDYKSPASIRTLPGSTRGVESAFLFLSSLMKD